MEKITIDLATLHGGSAKLALKDDYLKAVSALAGVGNEVIITGAAPVWLYLWCAHDLHGKATRLIYQSPATGDVVIFDHNPY